MVHWPRAIIHVDLDAFYASVEQLRRPELRGRAVIVGGGGEEYRRGVVSAASYEARRFGVHSAMPLARARRLCPHAVVLPVDFAAYRQASKEVFALARELTPQVEPLSLDEAYLDVTGSIARMGSPEQMAVDLRDRIASVCHLDASCGVATSKLVAKVASDLEKPRGMVVVPPGTEAAFLAPLPLRRLPGLGPRVRACPLAALGIATLGELAIMPQATLRRRLGEHAAISLGERARGIDGSAVTLPERPKSISREETFSADVAARAELQRLLRELCGRRRTAAPPGSLDGADGDPSGCATRTSPRSRDRRRGRLRRDGDMALAQAATTDDTRGAASRRAAIWTPPRLDLSTAGRAAVLQG